ncbi:MAG: glycosyltransferase family 4 protein [Bacteroidota bacterium]
MKILILNYEYPPIGAGGGVISKNTAQGLADSGNIVTVLTTWFEGTVDENRENLKIIRLKSRRKTLHKSNPLEMISWIKFASKYLKKNCHKSMFDICIANFTMPGGNVSLMLKKKFDLPYVVISHGHDIPWIKPKSLYLLHALNYFKIKKILKNSNLNFVQSDEMKRNIDHFLGAKYMNKNVLIPNGCNINTFYPDFSKRGKTFKILFVGRLVKQKDPMTFLRAIYEFKKTEFDFSVTILGDGPLRKRIEKFVLDKKIKSYVTVKGKVPESEVINEYQSAHLLVSTSISEGMSIAILEALFCGLYVLATPASGNLQLIADSNNGKIISFKNYAKLSSEIAEFYKTKFLSEYKFDENTMSEFRKKYSWEKIVNLYMEHLNNSLL